MLLLRLLIKFNIDWLMNSILFEKQKKQKKQKTKNKNKQQQQKQNKKQNKKKQHYRTQLVFTAVIMKNQLSLAS